MTTESLQQQFATGTCLGFNDTGDFQIAWPDAVAWTKNFRDKYGDNQLIGTNKIKGYLLSAGSVELLMKQDAKVLAGMRIYLGLDENDVFRVIIVGVEDGTFNDYDVPIPGADVSSSPNMPMIAEVRPCPEACGQANCLNKTP